MHFHAPPHAWWLLTFGLCWVSVMYGRREGYRECWQLNRAGSIIEPPRVELPPLQDWDHHHGAVNFMDADYMETLVRCRPRRPALWRRAVRACVDFLRGES